MREEPTISSLIKKAHQRMYFLRQLRKAKLPAQMLVQFYTAIIESILTSSITVWFAGATVRDKQRLQRIVHSAAFHRCRTCTSPDLEAGLVVSQPTPLTLHMDYSNHSPQAGDCGPSGLEPPATRTVSSPLLLDY
ncbi:unnamed protein product [Knipowitschia caucasica]